MSKGITEMNGSELVAEYNRLAIVSGINPIKAFRDKRAAIRKIEEMKKDPEVKENLKHDRRSKIAQQFNCVRGKVTFREKLLEHFWAHRDRQVTKRDLIKAVYGNNSAGKSKIDMVRAGLEATIVKNKLPYQIKKEKNEKTKELSFGFYVK